MPTYQYSCKACGREFEEWQSISSEPLLTCPSCSQNALVRLIGGGAGLIFKGSGFYGTDYRKDSSKSKEKSEPSLKKPETSSSEKTSKEKPSSSSDSKTDSTKKE